MKKSKRWLASLLVAMMLLSVLPTAVWAEDEEEEETPTVTEEIPSTPRLGLPGTGLRLQSASSAGTGLIPVQTETEATADLSAYLVDELSAIKASDFLAATNVPSTDTAITASSGDKVNWSFASDPYEYESIDLDSTMDLSSVKGSAQTVIYLSLGDPDQLDPNATRYIITVTLPTVRATLSLDVVYADGTQIIGGTSGRSASYNEKNSYTTGEDGERIYYDSLSAYASMASWKNGAAYISLSSSAAQGSDLSLKIYEGLIFTEEELSSATDISDKAVDAALSTSPNDGYEITLANGSYSNRMTAVWERNGEVVAQRPFFLYIGYSRISASSLKAQIYTSDRTAILSNSRLSGDNSEANVGTQISDADYAKGHAFVGLDYYSNTTDYNGLTVKAYEGGFRSAAELAAASPAEITSQIWKVDDISSAGGYDVTLSGTYTNKQVTLAWSNSTGDVLQVMAISLYIGQYSDWVYISAPLDENGRAVAGYASQASYDATSGQTYDLWRMIEASDSADGKYYAKATAYHNNALQSASEAEALGFKVVAGAKSYTDYNEAIADGAKDVTSDIFGDTGYQADFSGGVAFSYFGTGGSYIYYDTFKTIEATGAVLYENTPNLATDTYFYVTGANTADNAAPLANKYILKGNLDGYYYGYTDSGVNYGCQTIFILDSEGSSAYSGSLYPTFWTGYGVTAYRPTSGFGTSGDPVKSGTGDKITFENGTALHYTASAENGARAKNYYVTFVTQQNGATLYVNGTNIGDTNGSTGHPYRRVTLDAAHDYHHDVFFANIGNAQMTGITVTLDAEAQKTLKLDPIWDIGTTTTLAAFSTTVNNNQTGELPNVARVRLLSKTNDDGSLVTGNIGGTLTISYDGGSIVLDLTGKVAPPQIVTDTLREGVKYVPYNSMIQTDLLGASDGFSFELTSGALPKGVELQSNGKLYGVPLEHGDFTFTVTAAFDETKTETTKEFTLTIENNEDQTVLDYNDEGYQLMNAIRNTRDASDFQEETLRSEGSYGYFYALYLDGEKLTSGKDYTTSNGSTRITVFEQTFASRDVNGRHTLAAEFRTTPSDTNTVKRTSQNYYVTGGKAGSDTSDSQNSNQNNNQTTTTIGGGSSDGDSVSAISSGGTTTTPTTPTTPTAPVNVNYTATNGEATVSALTASEVTRLAEQATDGEIAIDLTASGEIVDTAVLPSDLIDKLADAVASGSNSADTVAVELTSATVVLDDNTLATIVAAAEGETVSLSVEETAQSDLSAAQQEALVDMDVEKIISAEITSGDDTISSFNGGRVELRVPLAIPTSRNPRGYQVWHIAPDGSKSLHSAVVTGNSISFRAAHFSDYVIVYEDFASNYSDVADDAWYTSFVDYVNRLDLMNGVGAAQFGPDMQLTRAMFAQIIYNAEKGAAGAPAKFSDVADDAWYADAVNWAAQAGIVGGMGNNEYAPEMEITREQMMTMLYNYASYKGYDLSRSAKLSGFSDGANISSWAQSAMEWAVGNKLIGGMNGTLLATGKATRAQVAKILAYFFEEYGL